MYIYIYIIYASAYKELFLLEKHALAWLGLAWPVYHMMTYYGVSS